MGRSVKKTGSPRRKTSGGAKRGLGEPPAGASVRVAPAASPERRSPKRRARSGAAQRRPGDRTTASAAPAVHIVDSPPAAGPGPDEIVRPGDALDVAPSDPALTALHRIETVLSPARAVEEPAARAEASGAPPTDPAFGCLRRIGEVVHGPASGEPREDEDARPGTAEATTVAGDATHAAGAAAPEREVASVDARPTSVPVAPPASATVAEVEPGAARAPASGVAAPADSPDRAREQAEAAVAARRSDPPGRQAPRAPEPPTVARMAAAVASPLPPARTGRPADRRAGSAPLRLRELAVPALAIVGFTGAMLGLVSVMTGDGPAAPAPSWAGPSGGMQQAAALRIAASAPAPSLEPVAAIAASSGHAAAPRLARALALATANREDVLNSTREGAREAEAEALEAFRLGASEIPGAWRVLADVYDANREWASDSNARGEYRRKERDALAHALELAPNDGEARYRYAMLMEDRGTRVQELARAVRDNPNAIEPRRWLGEDLLVSGKLDEGARLLVETAQLCSSRELNVYGPAIAVLLQNHGRAPEAAEVRGRMQHARP